MQINDSEISMLIEKLGGIIRTSFPIDSCVRPAANAFGHPSLGPHRY
jgi:hypothetical protein